MEALRVFGQGLLDLWVEARCGLCGRSSSVGAAWFCEEHRLERCQLAGTCCTTCGLPVGVGERCVDCLERESGLCGFVSAYRFEGSARRALLEGKLAGRVGLLRPLADGLARRMACLPWAWGAHFIPVPLHAKRRRVRGFNQSEVLARWLVETLGGSVLRVLKRRRATDPQGLHRAGGRERNVKGAFACRSHRRVSGRTVVLVDDVCTSGTTLRECARVLRRQAGVRAVYGVTCCRTVPLALRAVP